MAESEDPMAAVRESVAAYCQAHHDFAFNPRAPRVRLHEPTFGAEEIMAALECLLTTRVTLGPQVKAFEAEFKDAFGFAHAIMCNSGSSANLLAVAALTSSEGGLRPGDEVIVPALSWSTTVWPLIQHGLVPVVVDVDPQTLNIDAQAAARAVGPRTRGIMPVHVYGNPCDMAALGGLGDLIMIEDCCEALGAAFAGKPVGGFGRVGTYSFYFSHHMTTIEGGMCVTNDAELAERLRIMRAHGWVREAERPERYTEKHPDIDPRFLFVDIGYNLRPSELNGAMGRVQLPKLDAFIAIRRENALAWTAALAPFADVLSIQRETKGGFHSWFGFPIVVSAAAPFPAAALRRFLADAGVETRPLIAGNIARQPALARYPHRVAGPLPNADRVMAGGFAIGNHQAVNGAARDYMSGRIGEFVKRHGGG